ncbi:hypothetical protein FB451DRAFT_1486247 [Mycena latifolia]|nr:hypothetical protein FB451DRAFT_1486247 [Mycena latifolia]
MQPESTYAPPPGPPPVKTSTATQRNTPPARPPPPHLQQTRSPPPPGPPAPRITADLTTYILLAALPFLARHGWFRLPLPADLSARYSTLLGASSAFFGLPPTAETKTKFAAPSCAAASDEGFAAIPGEKQLVTLRRLSSTLRRLSSTPLPADLKGAAKDAWADTGALFSAVIEDIAASLGLPADIFAEMAAEANVASFDREPGRASSLLHLFRYERPAADDPDFGVGVGARKNVVAEAHRDLGLLTIVVGASPGLDARDLVTGEWVSVEDAPSGGGSAPSGGLTATIMSGQTLTYLTQGLHASGVHRVSVLPARPDTQDGAFRFSLIPPFPPAPLSFSSPSPSSTSPPSSTSNNSHAESNFPHCSMHSQPAAELFRAIAARHWNVNVAPEVREGQKRRREEAARVGLGEAPRDPGVADALGERVGETTEAPEGGVGETEGVARGEGPRPDSSDGPEYRSIRSGVITFMSFSPAKEGIRKG